jgi:hypothetical protein
MNGVPPAWSGPRPVVFRCARRYSHRYLRVPVCQRELVGQVPTARRHRLKVEPRRQAFAGHRGWVPGEGRLGISYPGSSERGIMIYNCRGQFARVSPNRIVADSWPLPGTAG